MENPRALKKLMSVMKVVFKGKTSFYPQLGIQFDVQSHPGFLQKFHNPMDTSCYHPE